jgi:hypothetical protein
VKGQRFWVDFLLAVYDHVKRSEILNHNDHFHDISSIFDDTAEPMYLDFAHVTEDANYLIAERIAQPLIAELTEKASGAQNADAE